MKKILLNRKKSVNSTDVDNSINIELRQGNDEVLNDNIIDTLNAYTIYTKERSKSNKFRISCNVNPYCSNILFNPITEIVGNKNNSEYKLLNNQGKKDIGNEFVNNQWSINSDLYTEAISGLSIYDPSLINSGTAIEGITRVQGVRDTEYSNSLEYCCGIDIFNNHLFRNGTFKSVNNFYNGNEHSVAELVNFNTIADTFRISNLKNKGYFNVKSFNLNTSNGEINKVAHVYDLDDIIDFYDAISDNLYEKNGWFGFYNKAKIPQDLNIANSEPFYVNRPINNKNACNFIEMYPNRECFSFTPQYNKFKRREENNWNFYLTYPASEEKINDGIIASCKNVVINENGVKIIVFRTPIKHNLKKNDEIVFKKDTTYDIYTTEIPITIYGIGDGNGENLANFFFCDYNELENIYNLDKFFTIEYRKNEEGLIMDENPIYTFKKIPFKKINNGIKCEYYYRKFKKIFTENEDSSRRELLPLISSLGFAKTIYGDEKINLLFDFDLLKYQNILDNKKRPLNTIYLTILKNNQGYKEWYGMNNTDQEILQKCRCFGKLNCGLSLPFKLEDEEQIYPNINENSLSTNNSITSFIINSNDESIFKDEINPNFDNEFYGDLVEYNVVDDKETIIEDVFCRFNTVQREIQYYPSNEKEEYKYIYVDDIYSDDISAFDDDNKDGFKILSRKIKYDGSPEGYIYKMHYPIKLKTTSIEKKSAIKEKVGINEININSSFETDANLRKALNISGETINVWEIKTDKNYFFQKYDKITTIINEGNDNVQIREDVVIEVYGDNYTHVIIYMPNLTSSDNVTLRKNNSIIPIYASLINDKSGKYVWHDVLNSGEMGTVNIEDYPFANGAFYIEQNINFYLKRQDPYGIYGLKSIRNENNITGDDDSQNRDLTFYEFVKNEENTSC